MDATQGRGSSGKRARDYHDVEMRGGGSSASDGHGVPEAKRGRTVECIDLTASSPPPEILLASQTDDAPRSSSPIEYGSADEGEVSTTENGCM